MTGPAGGTFQRQKLLHRSGRRARGRRRPGRFRRRPGWRSWRAGKAGLSYSRQYTKKLFSVRAIFDSIINALSQDTRTDYDALSIYIDEVGGIDPNSISGPSGPGSQDYLPGGATLPYTIGFQNEANATAPAQVVTVTQQLSDNVDWSTFQFGAVSFGGNSYSIPGDLQLYSEQINAVASLGIYVDLVADFNALTGLATWTFTSIDPNTQDVPANPLVGFLPPDTAAPSGERAVTYTVQAKSGLTTGTTISADASIVFDVNAAIDTGTYTNTIDATPPASGVAALPAKSTASFALNWSGTDVGSGVAFYSIYVSEDGAAYSTLLANTTATSTTFSGMVGHTYSFYSVATDNVGNVQPATTTTVGVVQQPLALTGPAFYLELDADGQHVDVWNGPTPSGSPAQSVLLTGVSAVTVNGATTGTALTVDLTNGDPLPATGLTFTGVAGGRTR